MGKEIFTTPPAKSFDSAAWHRFEQRTQRFWAIATYVLVALYVYDTYTEQPQLVLGWYGLGLAAIVSLFFAMYHLVLFTDQYPWPITGRRAVVYFGTQILVLALLVMYNRSFAGLGFVLFAHATGVLPKRWWTLPMLAILGLMVAAWRLDHDILAGNWDDVGFLLMQFVFWNAVFVFFRLLGDRAQEQHELLCQLQAAKAELERSAAQTEELAALRERTRLAREMHDSLGHALVVVNVKLEVAQRLYTKDPALGAAELTTTRELVRETMGELRRSLANLRAPLPDHHDLVAALQRMLTDISTRTQIDVSCDLPSDLAVLPPEISEVLWRVAKEALTNVERHAAAATVHVTLERLSSTLVLRIADDGSGIDPKMLQRPGHYGIIGMRERIAALDGSFAIQERPGGGTVVEVQVPLDVPTMETATRQERQAGEQVPTLDVVNN